MDKYNELLAILLDSKTDFEKFYDKGNFTAGTRVRKTMQNIKSTAQGIRTDISELKNAKKD